jgi:hypothetical protein
MTVPGNSVPRRRLELRRTKTHFIGPKSEQQQHYKSSKRFMHQVHASPTSLLGPPTHAHQASTACPRLPCEVCVRRVQHAEAGCRLLPSLPILSTATPAMHSRFPATHIYLCTPLAVGSERTGSWVTATPIVSAGSPARWGLRCGLWTWVGDSRQQRWRAAASTTARFCNQAASSSAGGQCRRTIMRAAFLCANCMQLQ